MKGVADRLRIPAAVGAVWAMATLAAGDVLAAILRSATGTDGIVGGSKGADGKTAGGTSMVDLVNNLLGEALIVTVILAPLAMAWGAGTMMFSTRGSGPQIIGASVVAVVLVAGAKGIAA